MSLSLSNMFRALTQLLRSLLNSISSLNMAGNRSSRIFSFIESNFFVFESIFLSINCYLSLIYSNWFCLISGSMAASAAKESLRLRRLGGWVTSRKTSAGSGSSKVSRNLSRSCASVQLCTNSCFILIRIFFNSSFFSFAVLVLAMFLVSEEKQELN